MTWPWTAHTPLRSGRLRYWYKQGHISRSAGKKTKEVNKKAIIFVTASEVEDALEFYEAGAFNYALGPVRDYNVKLAKELLETFDLDGLELCFI